MKHKAMCTELVRHVRLVPDDHAVPGSVMLGAVPGASAENQSRFKPMRNILHTRPLQCMQQIVRGAAQWHF